jgi:hypothetical protein
MFLFETSTEWYERFQELMEPSPTSAASSSTTATRLEYD